MSQGTGRPKERKRYWGTASTGSQNTRDLLSIKFTLTWVQFMTSQNNYNSNITDHWSQITMTNIIRGKSETLQELCCSKNGAIVVDLPDAGLP